MRYIQNEKKKQNKVMSSNFKIRNRRMKSLNLIIMRLDITPY